MTRVLSMVWYKVLPAHFGGQKGIALFSTYLSRHIALDMVCANTNKPDGKEGYAVIPVLTASKTQFIDPAVWKKISGIIEKGNYSHLLLEHCYYGWLGKWLSKKYRLPLIVHSHNIEYQRFRQLGKWWWPLLFRIEQSAHRGAGLSLFKTQADLDTAVKNFSLDPSTCMVVPYGLEKWTLPVPGEKFAARKKLEILHNIGPEKKILLFNGTLDYAPNADAVRQIVHHIAPKLSPDYVIIVCGRVINEAYMEIRKMSAPNYIYAGYVDDIETYFLGADAFINPVSKGGGVKVKVMEALSYGLPVISYGSGAIGINAATTGAQLTLVPDDDIDAFNTAVEGINYHASVPDSFFQEYHWEAITKRVSERISVLGR